MPMKKRRGRPKSDQPKKDFGTKELREKRMLGLTDEPLDACLKRDIITPDQHWAGIHFRWLYTIRHGVPSVRSVNLALREDLFGPREEDLFWRERREKEYNLAEMALARAKLKTPVIDVCVLGKTPRFLIVSPSMLASSNRLRSELEIFQEGLDLLVELWVR